MSHPIDMRKYIGKEVLNREAQRASISEIKGYGIYIKLANGSCRMLETGTGPYDNAVANESITFVDEELQHSFIEEYEKYRHSVLGEAEAFEYFSKKYS